MRACLDGGATCIQLRAKTLPGDRFLHLCDEAVRLAAACRALVIVNDRVDLAMMCGAGGVHLGQDDLPPAAARALLGAGAVIGCSTHTIAQFERAAVEPVDYLAIGPVFGTSTKETGYDAVGLELVHEAVRRSRGRPVVAIGGITLQRAASVWRAGAASVAVISDLLSGNDPGAQVASYNRVASAERGPGG